MSSGMRHMRRRAPIVGGILHVSRAIEQLGGRARAADPEVARRAHFISGGTGRGSRCRGCRGSPAGSAGSSRGALRRSPRSSARRRPARGRSRGARHHVLQPPLNGDGAALARALADAQRRVSLPQESPARPSSVLAPAVRRRRRRARAPGSSAAHDARTRTHAPRGPGPPPPPPPPPTSRALRRRRRRGGAAAGSATGGDTDEGVGDGSDGVAFEDQRADGGVARRRLREHRHRPPRDAGRPPTRRRLRDGEVSEEHARPLSRSRAPRPPPEGGRSCEGRRGRSAPPGARRRRGLGGEHGDRGRAPPPASVTSSFRKPPCVEVAHRRHRLLDDAIRPPPISRTRKRSCGACARNGVHRRVALRERGDRRRAAACAASVPRIPAAGRAGRRRPPTPRGAAPLRAPSHGRSSARAAARSGGEPPPPAAAPPTPPRHRASNATALVAGGSAAGVRPAERAQRGDTPPQRRVPVGCGGRRGVEEDRRDGRRVRRGGARRGARGFARPAEDDERAGAPIVAPSWRSAAPRRRRRSVAAAGAAAARNSSTKSARAAATRRERRIVVAVAVACRRRVAGGAAASCSSSARAAAQSSRSVFAWRRISGCSPSAAMPAASSRGIASCAPSAAREAADVRLDELRRRPPVVVLVEELTLSIARTRPSNAGAEAEASARLA